MKDLHLKFKMDTGDSATYIGKYGEDIPTESYIEWLEDLAEKKLNGLSAYSFQQIELEYRKRLAEYVEKTIPE